MQKFTEDTFIETVKNGKYLQILGLQEWTELKIGLSLNDVEDFDKCYKVVKKVTKLKSLFSRNLDLFPKKIENHDFPRIDNRSEKCRKQSVFDEKDSVLHDGIAEKKEQKTVLYPYMGSPNTALTPVPQNTTFDLPILSNFSSFKSLELLQTGIDNLVIGYDSEWFYKEDGLRCVTSWQFSLVWESEVHEFIFLRMCKKNITLEICLATILRELGFQPHDIAPYRRYNAITVDDNGDEVEKTYASRKEALKNSVRSYNASDIMTKGRSMKLKVLSGEYEECSILSDSVFPWTEFPSGCRIPVTLVCHTGKVDVTNFDQTSRYDKELLKFCSDVQGGLVTLQPIKINPMLLKPDSNRHLYRFPLSLSIADTMCHAPVGQKSLDSLGKVLGLPKIVVSDYYKSNMGLFFVDEPVAYIEYSARDSLVTLLYYSSLWGYNQSCRLTLSSASAYSTRVLQMGFLDCATTQEYDRKYRGLEKVKKGLTKRYDGAGFLSTSALEPINNDADMVQRFCSHAYYGGYNSCIDVGYYPVNTYDYDLSNAYPTAMCLVPDLDWECPIQNVVRNEELRIQNFLMSFGGVNPVPLFVGDVTFEFPPNVKYPCITHNYSGVPVLLRKSDGINAVYASGVEIVLALKLGAKVFCRTGFFLNPLIDKSGGFSYSMRHAVKQIVTDRRNAKEECGSGSLEELLLKVFMCSIYGKNAQNVIDKSSWSAYEDSMVDLGCSAITNPFSAMLITSIVRCELLAVQNQCEDLGYKALSVTTDGFISDIPFETLKNLDLYGLKNVLSQVRLFLTDDESEDLWEIKHEQNDLVNLCTRGNISLIVPDKEKGVRGGVCAHNSTRSGFTSGTYEDRHWLYEQSITRTGAVVCNDKVWTTFKDLVHGFEFVVKDNVRNILMDYDMKRKPTEESFEKVFVPLDGLEHEMMNFTTEPFETLEEFQKFRRTKKNVQCLRTEKDWSLFWKKIALGGGTSKPRGGDMNWAIIFGVVAGHRAMYWSIPELDSLRGQARFDFINTWNDSKRPFNSNDWKNAGRKNYQTTILDKELLEDKLKQMGAEFL